MARKTFVPHFTRGIGRCVMGASTTDEKPNATSRVHLTEQHYGRVSGQTHARTQPLFCATSAAKTSIDRIKT
eukprot:3581687-Amphidinium_carterae.1